MKARRWLAALAGCGLVLFGSARAPLAAPKPDIWTADEVREFVILIDRLMERLYVRQGDSDPPALAGTCRGFSVGPAIERSKALSYVGQVVAGKALSCYLATYLGCNVGRWIARPMASVVGPALKPFNRSKVTIVEQTPDRVVADVTELPDEEVWNGVATVYLGEDEHRPYTDAEIAAITDKSRYTLSRGKDGNWRITDRKPSFKWICSGDLDRD